jgi:predicted nuclease with TOPRIM domain
MAEKDRKIEELQARVLELMTRPTATPLSDVELVEKLQKQRDELIKEKEKLTTDNNRLRGEKKHWWEEGKKLYDEKQKVAEVVPELVKTITRLEKKVATLEVNNKILKDKVNSINQVVIATPPKPKI